MSGQWSRERIWDWYDRKPWIRGCDFSESEEELKLAEDAGFNAVRLNLEYAEWKENRRSFMERLEKHLGLIHGYGMGALLILGRDELLLKENFPDAGAVSRWAGEIMQKYRQDDRVLAWNLWETSGGNGIETNPVPYLRHLYETAWEVNPIQPNTSAVMTVTGKPEKRFAEAAEYAWKNSDMTGCQSAGTYLENVMAIWNLKVWGRPVVNTRWLTGTESGRMGEKGLFLELFPLFFLEKIGCFNGRLIPGFYGSDLKPRDIREAELICQLCRMADQEKEL